MKVNQFGEANVNDAVTESTRRGWLCSFLLQRTNRRSEHPAMLCYLPCPAAQPCRRLMNSLTACFLHSCEATVQGFAHVHSQHSINAAVEAFFPASQHQGKRLVSLRMSSVTKIFRTFLIFQSFEAFVTIPRSTSSFIEKPRREKTHYRKLVTSGTTFQYLYFFLLMTCNPRRGE